MALVVAGGLGFLTLEELRLRRTAERNRQIFRVSVHSRLVLATTAALLAGGWVLFTLFEWDQALRHLPWHHKLVNGR